MPTRYLCQYRKRSAWWPNAGRRERGPVLKQYRHEFKYELDHSSAVSIESRLRLLAQRDAHAGKKGSYTIRSLYFDDYDDTNYWDNESGSDPREKFRLRMYNGDPSFIQLELKRKEHEKTLKLAVPVSTALCEKILDGRRIAFEETSDSALLRKFWLQQEMKYLHPCLLVEYDRTPYVYPEGNVRITFDRNIRGGPRWEDFLREETFLRPIMPVGCELMEVKYDQFLPDPIAHTVTSRRLHRTAYSKYYLCRTFAG